MANGSIEQKWNGCTYKYARSRKFLGENDSRAATLKF